MAITDILAGLSGGLTGFAKGATLNRDAALQRDTLDEQRRSRSAQERQRQAELDLKTKKDQDTQDEQDRQRQAQMEIIDGMPDANPDGSPNQLKLALKVQYAGAKATTSNAIIRNVERAREWDTPSANVTTAEDGRNTRWDRPSGNAELSAETQRYGADKRSRDSRYGAATRDATTRRGQDLDFQFRSAGRDGLEARAAAAEEGRNARAAAAEEGRNLRAKRGLTFSFDQPQGPPTPTAPAPVTPPPAALPITPRGGQAPTPVVPPAAPAVVAPPKSVLPITPRASATPKPPADALAGLTTQASTLLAQFNAEKDPQRKQALAAQLKQLRDQIVAARK